MKYNFNNDKGTEEVFGFDEGDESWEIKNNTSNRVLWKSADYSGSDWLNDFEGRYPEDNDDPTNLASLAAWLASTDQSAATGNNLSSSVTYDGTTYTKDTAAYRLAKFKNEFTTHFEKDSAIFYYLFTELFLMVDSRAKNAFPSFLGSDKWCFLPYDFDTAIGINNEGSLVFDYSLEDIDTTSSGADVFNGQQSVLWVNLRAAFFDDIRTMYQNLRSTGKLSYSVVENMFETHQNKWCEAIFNEDAWFKYINPLTEDGSGAYLAMAQGSKAEQRKWWLYNRFRYMDSKYNAGDALTDVIQVRGYAKDNITVTPYADIYPSVKFGSYLVSQRGARNTSTTLNCPLDNVNDTEIYIYSASQLSSVGDLSGLKVGFADFSMATRLQSIKVGSNASGYTNGNLTELHVGNNTLLNSVDVRNCTALTGAVDLSGCTNVEHVYFDGTAITSCALPNGGILKTLKLPATITNLTLRNQSAITTFVMAGYTNITTLRLENTVGLPVESIINGATSLNRVRLVGMEWTATNETSLQSTITKLRACNGLDESGNNTTSAVVTGRVHISSISSTLLSEINTYFPGLVVVVNNVPQYIVSFKNYDNSTVYAMVVAEGSDAVDPVASGLCNAPEKPAAGTTHYVFDHWSSIPTNVQQNTSVTAVYKEAYRVRYLNDDGTVLQTVYVTSGQDATYTGSTPTKASTAEWIYTFSGWSGTQTNITSSRDITAQYIATKQKYTVRFYNGTTLLQTVNNVEYGGNATYTGTTPSSSNPDYVFTGFNPNGTLITGNTDCYAVFVDTNSPLTRYLKKTLETYESGNDATKVAEYAFYNHTSLTTVTTKANVIEQYAFNGCSNLTTVDMTGTSAAQIAANAFNGNAKLAHLIIRSTTVGTMSATSALTGTMIASGNGAIYVPSDLVATYKAASNWSTYANQIYPISAYPKTDFSTISDSWDEIFAAEANGTYSTKYSVGDTKLLTVSNGSSTVNMYMQIAALDGDTLSDNSGNAKITWICKSILTTHNMNSSATTSGGWSSTAMRSWLRSTILPSLPANVQSAIKEVKKTYYDYGTTSTLTENDTIWIPSHREMGYSSPKEDSGVIYSGLFTSNSNRIKLNASGSAYNWWLRSANNGTNFYSVNINGNNNNNNASGSGGVVFGFCT